MQELSKNHFSNKATEVACTGKNRLYLADVWEN